MGRLAARVLLLRADELGLDLVHINEVKGVAALAAYTLEFDSAKGRLPFACSADAESSEVLVRRMSGGELQRIKYTTHAAPDAIPWKESEVEVVFECTGAILSSEKIQLHFGSNGSSVKKVVVSAPVDNGGILNVVMGCNDNLVKGDMRIVTAASCTTNCAAPIVGAIDSALGIELGSINTIHNVTPTQAIMDGMDAGKKNDMRRARSGALNLAPTSTGSAKAITMIYPHLKGKLNGLAVRVPCQNASITDLVLLVKRDTTVEEVNQILKKASDANPAVLGYEVRPLVSTDYINDPRSSIVDALSTQVVGNRLVKIFSWYDNEWGYVNRMVELGKVLAAKSRL